MKSKKRKLSKQTKTRRRNRSKSGRNIKSRRRKTNISKSRKLSKKISKDGVGLKKLIGLLALNPIVKSEYLPTGPTTEYKDLTLPKYKDLTVSEYIPTDVYSNLIDYEKISENRKYPYIYIEKSDQNFLKKILTENFPIPEGERIFNEENIIQYFNYYRCDCETKQKMMQLIYDTTYISFNDLLYTTYNTIKLFERVFKDDYTLIIQSFTQKSNYWMSQLFFNLVNNPPKELSLIFDNLNHQNILLVDDMLYSGIQMYEKIEYLIEKYPDIKNIYVLVPFTSVRALKYFNRFSKPEKLYLIVGEVLNTNSDIKNDSRDRVIFDHKIADSVSIPDEFYMYGNYNNCNIDNFHLLNKVDTPYKSLKQTTIPSKKLKKIAKKLTENVKLKRRIGKDIIEKINYKCKNPDTFEYLKQKLPLSCGCQIFKDIDDNIVTTNYELFTTT